jgi:hypothetical protein
MVKGVGYKRSYENAKGFEQNHPKFEGVRGIADYNSNILKLTFLITVL